MVKNGQYFDYALNIRNNLSKIDTKLSENFGSTEFNMVVETAEEIKKLKDRIDILNSAMQATTQENAELKKRVEELEKQMKMITDAFK